VEEHKALQSKGCGAFFVGFGNFVKFLVFSYRSQDSTNNPSKLGVFSQKVAFLS
jgi:hypothetical protein